jgi:hypothetical protein
MKKLAVVFFIVLITAAAAGLTVSDRLAAGDATRIGVGVTGGGGVAAGAGVGDKPAGVRIIQGPTLESSTDTSAIVRWTTNSVDGTTVRYGVVHFGVDPRNLSQVAKSQNRFNRGLPSMIYRVQVDNLEPGLTYYYSVESTNATGASEGINSEVHQFTTQRHQ